MKSTPSKALWRCSMVLKRIICQATERGEEGWRWWWWWRRQLSEFQSFVLLLCIVICVCCMKQVEEESQKSIFHGFQTLSLSPTLSILCGIDKILLLQLPNNSTQQNLIWLTHYSVWWFKFKRKSTTKWSKIIRSPPHTKKKGWRRWTNDFYTQTKP